MRKVILNAVALCLVAQLATAQIRLPQPSPGATIIQTVGTTDFTVKYSRPSLKGRTPFTGSFVPAGKVWRTGANGATTFQATTDVVVEGQKLAAGTYSIMSIPNASEWTIIFNKNLSVTEDSYKQEEDALRVNVKPTTGSNHETFTISFSDLTDSTANMNIMFGPAKATAKMYVDVNANAAANVMKAVADKPEDAAVLQAAANYNLSKGTKLDQALAWADKSIGLKETYRNLWIKSQILAKMGKFTEALPIAQKALSIGESTNDGAFPFFKDAIAKAVTEYQAKLPAPTAIKGKTKKK